MNKGPIGWIASMWRFVWDVALRWYYGRVGDLAASVTFWLLVSLPATVLALLAILGPIDRLLGHVFPLENGSVEFQSRIQLEVSEFIGRILTDEGGEIQATVTALFSDTNPGLSLISAAFALWSISRGFAGLIRSLEDIYDIAADERRPWYITRVVAVFLGVGSVLIPLPLIVLDQFVWDRVGSNALFDWLRIVTLVAVLILWASIVYHFGPATRSRWLHDLPGAVIAALMWWLLTIGFGQYVDLTLAAEGADEVRAAVGIFLLAITWIWLAAQVLLIGGAVNQILGDRLGISRSGREWSIPDMVTKSTGEIKRIINTDSNTAA
ncbi:MAG: YihY/virulence factor BrkB family protein [Acidimicrobiia bacterium]|nr:YihY/virulence factor BrkB family protein [Acidimicrobiia bacterium]